MKNSFILVVLTIVLFTTTSCFQKEIDDKNVYLGLKVEIVSVDKNNEVLTVVGVDDDKKFFPSEVQIDCSNLEDNSKIVEIKSISEIRFLTFESLKVKDLIKINISDYELREIDEKGIGKVEQIEVLNNN